MELKTIKRNKLTEALRSQAEMLRPNAFFITSLRATANNTVQVEVCQNRNIAGRRRTLIGMINSSDKRFRSPNTLLFDWMKLEPADFLKRFPDLKGKITEEDLKAIAESYDPDGPKGQDALVYKAIHSINHVYDPETDEKLTPVISVTEVTHTQLTNGEFFRGENAEEKIENELNNGTSVMRTGSDEDSDFIVDSETGEKIYRFTRTVFKEDYPKEDWDSIIPNKVTLSVYNKSKGKSRTATKSPEDLILQDDEI